MSTQFSWQTGESTQESSNPIRRRVIGANRINTTEALTINGALTRGLYHNSYPGLKLAGALAFPMIFIPVAFMGLPILKTDGNDALEEELNQMVLDFSRECFHIHIQSHREGTIWIWPYYDSRVSKVCWEFIRDESVTTIIKDINNGQAIALIVDEELTISTNEFDSTTVQRRRTFTEDLVKIEYMGYVPPQVGIAQSAVYRNPIGMLPIVFNNNADAQEMRGHSDYERLLSDFKDYHDVSLAWSELLAKFSVKMVQHVTDVRQWLENNGLLSDTEGGANAIANAIGDLDIASLDFIANKGEDEKTGFVFPEGAHEAYEKKLSVSFFKFVQGSGIPELVWGLQMTGNHASVEQQMSVLVQHVKNKKDQKTAKYQQLFLATWRLRNGAQLRRNAENNFYVTWDDMDGLDASTRATIFQRMAQGFSVLMQNVAMTKKQLHAMWLKFAPDSTEEEFEKFNKDLIEAAQFKSYTTSSYTDLLGETPPIADAEGMINPMRDPDEMDDEDREPEDMRDANDEDQA